MASIDGIDLMIQSVYKPDIQLRQEATEAGCFHELMEVRAAVLDFLHEMRIDLVSE